MLGARLHQYWIKNCIFQHYFRNLLISSLHSHLGVKLKFKAIKKSLIEVNNSKLKIYLTPDIVFFLAALSPNKS
jgi:hypothetical protein